MQEQGKLGVSASKSVPLGQRLSLTLGGGASATETLTGVAPEAGVTPTYTVSPSARLNIVPTGTSITAGGSRSTADGIWLRKLSVNQRLFDGLSLTGAVDETVQGPPDARLIAGFKRSW